MDTMTASATDWGLNGSAYVAICLGDEMYVWSSARNKFSGLILLSIRAIKKVFAGLRNDMMLGSALTMAISEHSSRFYSLNGQTDAIIISKEGGDFDYLTACQKGYGQSGTAVAENRIYWKNLETYQTYNSGTNFGLGGEHWGDHVRCPGQVRAMASRVAWPGCRGGE